MDITDFQLIEEYMLECMQDSAHDKEHIYRVLYVALDIAEQERHVDYDLLIAACLLHDIGRRKGPYISYTCLKSSNSTTTKDTTSMNEYYSLTFLPFTSILLFNRRNGLYNSHTIKQLSEQEVNACGLQRIPKNADRKS